jgi:predicted AlkP superfamily phosphohydrolase/phosphomutase
LKRINRIFLSLHDVDWTRTRVYSKGNYGQLFLNLKGREPGGIVAPGEEADRLVDEVITALRGLQEPDTGQPLIGGIWRSDELYRGPFLGRAPDITFLPRDMRNKALGTLDFTSHRFIEPVYGNSGDHRMNGIFFMRGEGVRRGAAIEGATLVDVAPTILHYLGEPVPSSFDGRVLTQVFTESESAAHPVRTVDLPEEKAAAEAGYGLTRDEMAEIRERLKRIGYLG